MSFKEFNYNRDPPPESPWEIIAILFIAVLAFSLFLQTIPSVQNPKPDYGPRVPIEGHR